MGDRELSEVSNRGMRAIEWIGAVGAIAIIAALLSAPAGLYALKTPTTVNLLSLVFTFGFFVALCLVVRNRVALIVVGAFVLILNLIEIVSLLSFGGLVSLGGLAAVLYVDPTEAREFLGDHAGAIVGGAAVAPLFVALVWLEARLLRVSRPVRLGVAAVAVVVPATLLSAELVRTGNPEDVYLPTRYVEHFVAYLGVNPLTGTLSGIAATLAARHELAGQHDRRAVVRFEAERTAAAPERELWVVVVGESSRRANWSLFGYGRHTNPRLSRVPGLTAFRDAVSPATTTSSSVPQSFYFPTEARDGSSQVTGSFVSAFRAAGYETFWLSNQGTHRSAVGGPIALLMQEAERVATTNYGFWNSVLDEALIAEFDRALADPTPRKLIVVHTLGSHTNYRQRYPADWIAKPLGPDVRDVHAFGEMTEADAQIVDDYDRTILYTDWLLGELLGRLARADLHGGLVYFSDHGQRLYDDASHAKGHGFGDLKAMDVEIPLLVWLSETYGRARPETAAAIAANATRPASTVDMAASLLDLAGFRVKQIAPGPSFAAAGYDVGPRRVLMTDGRLLPYGGTAVTQNMPATDTPASTTH